MVHRGHVKIEWASMPLIDVWTSRCMPVAVIAKRLPRNYLARGLLSSLLLSFYEINNPEQPAPSLRPSREIVVREPFRRLGPCLYTRAHTCTVTYMSAGRFLHSPGHDCIICKSLRSGQYCMADTIASATGPSTLGITFVYTFPLPPTRHHQSFLAQLFYLFIAPWLNARACSIT